MKADSHLFRTKIDELSSNTAFGERRKWVPYLYHFTDLRNVVEILRSGQLLCRNEAQNQANFQDIASTDIIQQTPEKWKNYVRFYFRPKTPTLYRNEGFRPHTSQQLNAHCPMPIYLMFDLLEIITNPRARFTDGSLASNDVQVFSSGEEFSKLPFNSIYHEGFFEPSQRKIIFHRHAEVIIPQRINLRSLKYIWCRSQAEYETLQYLLPQDVWKNWRTRIISQSTSSVFFKEWSYISQATLTHKEIQLKFNLAAKKDDYGSFKARLEIIEKHPHGTNYVWVDDNYYIQGESITIDISSLTYPDDYIVTFTLDGHLAYQNRFIRSDIPF